MSNASRTPDLEGLVRCAHQHAQALSVRALSDAEARALMERVLFGEKQGWLACDEGLVTREELTNLLLAHLETQLGADGMGVDRPDLFDRAYQALFGGGHQR